MTLFKIGIDFKALAEEGRDHVEFAFPTSEGEGSRPGPWPTPRALLSLRSAGSMRYLAGSHNPRRERFFASLGLGEGSVVSTELHHTRRLRFITKARGAAALRQRGGIEADAGDFSGEDAGEGGPENASGRDGIVLYPYATDTAGVSRAAAITVADYMPIWIFDSASGAYGVLHSGWRGTGILAHAVTGLLARSGGAAGRAGGGAASVSVILGPSIGSCCYRVPEARARDFEREFGADSVLRDELGPRLDLREANRALAAKLGVGALLSVEACTVCEEGLGSYRREGAGDFTRMVALCISA